MRQLFTISFAHLSGPQNIRVQRMTPTFEHEHLLAAVMRGYECGYECGYDVWLRVWWKSKAARPHTRVAVVVVDPLEALVDVEQQRVRLGVFALELAAVRCRDATAREATVCLNRGRAEASRTVLERGHGTHVPGASAIFGKPGMWRCVHE